MNAHPHNRPVLVVGAGPTGLTAAMELSRLGIDVRIIDKADQPSASSRALGIQARTIELLRPRGVADEMLRLGHPADSTVLYGRRGQLATIELHRMSSRYNFVLLLAQSETERLLSQQLIRQGVKTDRGAELVSFEQRGNDDGVRAVVRSSDGAEEVVDATYLIAADGAHSGVRKGLGLLFDGRALDQQYLLGDVHIDGEIAENQLSIFLAPDGFVAVFPMGQKRFRLMATDPAGEAADSTDPTLDQLQGIFEHVCQLPARPRDLAWSSRFRINSRYMSTLRAGQVFFGGDAAHVHSPAGGQGMNAGIQDMINLSWKLAMVLNGRAGPDLLDTYQSDRLPVIRKLVRMTERATTVFNSTNPVVHQVITRLAPVVLRSSKVQASVAPMLGQISAGYRGCPIAANGGRIGRLHAGDRVPDLDVSLAGQPTVTRLYDKLDLGRLTLFVMGGAPGDDAKYAARLWRWREIVSISQVSIPKDLGAGLLLVRPDGYAAAATANDDLTPLTSWLGRWFAPTT